MPYHERQSETIFNPFPGCQSQVLSALLAQRKEMLPRICKYARVAGGHHEARVFDEKGRVAHVSDYARNAAGHCFTDDVWKSLSIC